MPTISVIVPVYKVEKYIHRCIDSILNQTFRDFELILVDDGSPDNCGTICDEYAAKDSRIRVIHQENGGLSAARNAGIDWAFANSDSQWLTFIDSDDWVHPEYLERLLNAAVENHVAVSVCGYVTTEGEEPDTVDSEMIPRVWNPENFYVENRVNAIIAWAKLYQKNCFQTIRYPVGKIHEDEFTTYKILFACDKIAVDSASLYYYYVNSEGITKALWSPARMAAIDAVEEQIAYLTVNGFDKAQMRAVQSALRAILRMLENIHSSDTKYELFENQLRKKLRRYIRKYKKTLGLRPGKNCDLYEEAYPGLMKMYWYGFTLCRKLGIRR